MKQVAVIGLGRFGKKLALSLYKNGVDVMAVDKDEELVERISSDVTYAIRADVNDVEAIKGLGLEDVDAVVVAIGSDLTSSIMAVMVAKEVGVPYVMAKAADERMGEILTKIGADKVIYPEEETGERTARKLMSDSFMEFFDIDNNLCLVEIRPKKEWIGKNLVELKLREKYKINVVAVKDNHKMHSTVDPMKPVEEDMTFLVILKKADLKGLTD
ncbi:MAG: TrkA family potassium uptake protein [Eubacterium sp.]|nr:TrkA family potassium uptake protein [Eubacterium sp.]